MRSTLFLLPLSAAAQQFTGTIFHDYNSNGVRDVDSPGFYESSAVSIPVELHSCDDEMQILTYSNEEGVYSFNVTEGCYYLFLDKDLYSLPPYVEPGEVTQMETNQVYPGNGQSVEAYVSTGETVVWNVGIVDKSAVAAVEETSTTTSTEMMTTSSSVFTTTTENYSQAFFAQDGDDDNATDVVDADDFTDVVDTIENSTDVVEDTFIDAVDTLDNSTTASGFDAVEETTSTVNAETLFGGDSITSGGDSSSEMANVTTGDDTNTTDESATFTETSNATTIETVPTGSMFDETVNEDSSVTTSVATATSSISFETSVPSQSMESQIEEVASTNETAAESEESKVTNTSKPTVSPTATNSQSKADEQSDKEAEKTPEKESGKESKPSDGNATVSMTDNESKGETTNSGPSAKPTSKPTSCIGCELSLQTIVRIQLDNIDSKLSDDSKTLFESVCASFLEEQLSIATPPVGNLTCVVVEESYESQTATRSLRGVDGSDNNRELSQIYLADVEVTGSALSTQSHQTAESIKFKELCVGTFTVQGFLFVRALKEAEETSSSNGAAFQSVENVRGVMTYDASEASSGEQIDDPSDPEGGLLSTGTLAAIAAGSVFCAMCFLVFIVARARNNRKNKYNDLDDERSGKTKNKSGKDIDTAIYDEFPELSRPSPANSNGTGITVFSRPSPSNSQGSGPAMITPVSIRSNTEEVEVDMIPDSFSGEQEQRGQTKASMLNSRVRRDLMAPAGKLGIMVANTAGFVSTMTLLLVST